jgi:transposase InsO family protein
MNSINKERQIITPIISRRCLDRVYMDLMDFTSQPDGEYHWVLQLKDHFSRMVWLFPLRNKSSIEVAKSLLVFFTWCGQPQKIYSDNGKEFQLEVDDLLRSRYPPIPNIHGRPYHPQTQGI